MVVQFPASVTGSWWSAAANAPRYGPPLVLAPVVSYCRTVTSSGVAVLGLDVGTTGIKAVAFSPESFVAGDGFGRELAAAIVPTPTRRPSGATRSTAQRDSSADDVLVDAGGEFVADEMWDASASAIRSVVDQLAATGFRVVGVGVTSMGEAGAPLDANGQATHPIIAWFDPRTEPQARWWSKQVGDERTAAITGIPVRPVFGMMKLLWIRQNAPDAYARTVKWLNMADYAVFRLTGQQATDYCLASRTQALDLQRREWSTELLDAIDVPLSVLADLVPSGTVIGRVGDRGPGQEAAATTGLEVGCPVVLAGQDHVAAAHGLGVTEPGDLLDSIGTAEALFMVTEQPEFDGHLSGLGIGQGAHVTPNRTYAMTGLANGGGRIDTVRRHLDLDWDEFMDQAVNGGPQNSEISSVIDEIARSGQNALERLVEAVGASQVRHLLTGGGTRNGVLIERKQSLSRRPLHVMGVEEASCFGAAALAATAIDLAG